MIFFFQNIGEMLKVKSQMIKCTVEQKGNLGTWQHKKITPKLLEYIKYFKSEHFPIISTIEKLMDKIHEIYKSNKFKEAFFHEHHNWNGLTLEDKDSK